ncbi:hypothetical protein FG386_000861 [Cryptosporidium ryanae]|uniref:uncharacterized protein n=1 Tax=Cryptosporidium ryanae TaxID=515981 RepID=UPI00351A50E5|nr:hypothetical protein FG386_000861 [Cryptosporidium ryanae]
MKRFIFFPVFIAYVNLVIALSNTKSKRRSQGLIFRSTFEYKEQCTSLGCVTGKGYIGTLRGDCFSVKRCNGCSKTQYLGSAMSYCSEIPPFKSEVTIFSGFLESLTSLDTSSLESETNEDINEEEKEASDIEESEDDDDDDDGTMIIQTKKEKNEKTDKRTSISSSEVFFSSGSLLQLYSQISESSEIEDTNSNNGKQENKKKIRKGIKGIFNRIFSKKKKKNNLNEVNKTGDFVKKNIKFNKILKKKELNLKKKLNEGISDKIKREFVRKDEVVEFILNGDEMNKRISSCSIVNGFASIQVHLFFQFYNTKRQNSLISKRFKYPAFELMVDTKCKDDKSCANPSRFIGRLTPHQKLVMSNSLSITTQALESGIKQVLNNARVYYRCKSPKCFPKQYNSCVKITCTMNSESKDREWSSEQVRYICEILLNYY